MAEQGDTATWLAGIATIGAMVGGAVTAVFRRKKPAQQQENRRVVMDAVTADHERRLTILEERDREDREERERRDRRDEQYRNEVKALIEGIFKQIAQIRDDTTTLKAILDEQRAKR